jgi:hypothetical protein
MAPQLPNACLAYALAAPGQSHLSDGTIVAGGGDWANGGFLLEGRYALRTWAKDATAWAVRPEGLAAPHWYPTQLSLPDDRVLFVGGYASEADPPVPAIEIWDARAGRVTTITPEPFLLALGAGRWSRALPHCKGQLQLFRNPQQAAALKPCHPCFLQPSARRALTRPLAPPPLAPPSSPSPGGLNLYPTTLLLPWANAEGNAVFIVFSCNQGVRPVCWRGGCSMGSRRPHTSHVCARLCFSPLALRPAALLPCTPAVQTLNLLCLCRTPSHTAHHEPRRLEQPGHPLRHPRLAHARLVRCAVGPRQRHHPAAGR